MDVQFREATVSAAPPCERGRCAVRAARTPWADSVGGRDDSPPDVCRPGCPPPDPEDVWVLARVADGDTTEKVARQLGVSERTIRRRLRAVADAFGVDCTIQAVVQAVRLGLI